MSRTRYKVTDQSAIHFVTCTIVNWLPILAKPQPKVFIKDSLCFLQARNRLTLFAYVIMENHLHMIARADNLSASLGAFKSYTARIIIDFLKQERNVFYLKQLKANKLDHHKACTYQLWQEGIHPKLIANRDMMIQKITYIHNNPVKRGYVELPEHWLYSSARNYSQGEGLIDVCLEW